MGERQRQGDPRRRHAPAALAGALRPRFPRSTLSLGPGANRLAALADGGWLKPGAIASVELASTEDLLPAAALRDD
jgi:hypothetical protein